MDGFAVPREVDVRTGSEVILARGVGLREGLPAEKMAVDCQYWSFSGRTHLSLGAMTMDESAH